MSVEEAKETLERFDASIVVERFQSQREKVHFDEGSLDLSIPNLLKIYAEQRALSNEDLQAGFDLINTI